MRGVGWLCQWLGYVVLIEQSALGLSGAELLLLVCSNVELTKGYSPFLSFNVKDMDSTVLRLLSMGAELDGPIKYPPQGKVRLCTHSSTSLCLCLIFLYCNIIGLLD